MSPVVDLEFVLKCNECKLNAFLIVLNSHNPYDIKQIECFECGKIMNFEEEEEDGDN